MDQSGKNEDYESEASAIGHADLAHIDDLDLGPLSIAPSRRLIAGPLAEATLEPKVMVVLVALARAGKRTLSKDDLIRQCWDGRIVGDASINRVISLLRTALRETTGDAVQVETIPKVGYRLRLGHEPQSGFPSNQDWTSGPRLFGRPGFFAIVGGVALALLAGVLVNTFALTSQTDRMSIAMLPFDVAEGTDGLFASGMASELKSELARHAGLEITSPESARQLISNDSSPQQIGSALKIDNLLRGSIEADDNRTVLNVEMVDTETGLTVWQETFASGLDSAETLPARAARELIQAIGLQAAESGADRRIPDADFQLYLTALGMIETRDPEQLQQAADNLGEIVDRNPRFSAGWAARAKAVGLLFSALGDRAMASLAHQFADKALELNPNSVEALKILGLIHDEADRRIAFLDRAIELDPGDAEAWLWLGHVADHPDHYANLPRAMVRLVELDPLWDRSWQAGYYVRSSGDPATADRLDTIIGAAAAEPWQAELAEARIAVRKGDQSEFVRVAREAMAVVSPRERQVLSLQLINQAHLLNVSMPAMPSTGIAGAANGALIGSLPSETEMDALGVEGEQFFSILPFVIGGSPALIADGREAQLVRYYDQAFGSAKALEEFANMQLRTHHFLPQIGTYVGFALSRVGREDEAVELFDLAEKSVALWNEKAPNMTSKMFEANLAAAKGETQRAVRALEAAIGYGWPYNTQSPGVAAQGPLSRDAIWGDLSDTPGLERLLAPIKANIAKERSELIELGS